MENTYKTKVSFWELFGAYIVIDVVISVILGCLYSILLIFLAWIVKNTALSELQMSDNQLLIVKGIKTIIKTIIVSLVFCVVIKKKNNIDKYSLTKFFTKVTIIFTFLSVFSIIGNTMVGYKKIYGDLNTLHIASDIVEDEYRTDPVNFVGTGFAEGCKTLEDIHKAEEKATKGWISYYFVTPTITTGVSLLARITCLITFFKVFKFDTKKMIVSNDIDSYV